MTAVSPLARSTESIAASELREHVRGAIERGTPCRIVGGGTWLDAGRPVYAEARLDVRPYAGIVEYVPGDLTLTALGGTTLAELEQATTSERQWLPLDPFGHDGGTLGGTIATASAGPLAHGFGGVRDNVLGVEVVTGRGEIVRAGGRVVKNVAGFDLTRLMVGAWGTLGAITEVTVRLRACPEADRTLAAPLPEGAAELERLLSAIRRAPLTPLAMQLVDGALARTLDVGDDACLLMRLGGNEDSMRAQYALLAHALTSETGAATAEIADAPPTVWDTLRSCEPADAIVLRLAAPPATLPFLWSATTDAVTAVDGAFVHAWCGTGTVRVIVPAGDAADDPALAALLRALPEARRIGERLPPALWERLAPGAVNDPLSRRVRAAFDPDLLLNPGILGEVME